MSVEKVHVLLKLGDISLKDEDHDVDGAPITYDTGYNLTMNGLIELQSSYPAGSFSAKITGLDGSGSSVSCVLAKF